MSEKGDVVALKKKPSAVERVAALQKRREELREASAEARAEQKALDLEAILELELTHGDERVIAIEIECWKPQTGAPVLVAVLVPGSDSHLAQRFIEQINKSKEGSKERLAAADALATECWGYPAKDSEAYKAMIELAPLIRSHAAFQIVKAVQGRRADEGKE